MYSYRASKAALNQVIKTFDLQLKMKKIRLFALVYIRDVKTDLSKGLGWNTNERLFEPEDAAQKWPTLWEILNVVLGVKCGTARERNTVVVIEL